MASNTGLTVNTGQTGGYIHYYSGTNKSTLIATVDDLVKMTGWIWGGRISEVYLGDYKECPSKGLVTNMNYNQISVASGTSATVTTKRINVVDFDSPTSGYDSTRLIRRDDVKVAKVPIAVEVKTQLTLNPDPFDLKVYLSNSSTDTTEARPLFLLTDVDCRKDATLVNYHTITLPNYIDTTETMFNRDSYICLTIDGSDWNYARYIGVGCNGNYNAKKTTDEVKTLTINTGVKWREFITDGCLIHVKIANKADQLQTWE